MHVKIHISIFIEVPGLLSLCVMVKKKKSTEKTDVFDYLFSGEHVHLSRPRAGMSLSIQSDLISMSTQEF